MAKYWKLYKKAKAFYFGLGKIKCPALRDEEIIFDWRGFRHFLHKKRRKRSVPDQIRRFKILFKIPDLINSAKIFDRRDMSDGNRKTVFLSLLCKDEDTTVKIVTLDDGKDKYFISIMDY